MNVRILVANADHIIHTHKICELMYVSALQRGTGIAARAPEYIAEKMQSSKAVIALDGDKVVGFSYIETWSHGLFVANSGLIVDHEYRNQGLGRTIKKAIFDLSRKLYPTAKIFSITTGLAVMKLNTELGYRPVPFSELTNDSDFWDGCRECRNYDILERNHRTLCLCTGMLFDPNQKPHI
jgi:GNAT superfamily N-acetyltransferase